MALLNVARNALRPHYLPVMARKALVRTQPPHREEALAWATEHAEPVEAFAIALDAALWEEAARWTEAFEVRARVELDRLAIPFGGAGHIQLMYFLVRRFRPHNVLETGVAAGWTSAAILEALEANHEGALWSSDFPYFRLDEPEQHIGCLVPERLRDGWHLGVRGDRANLSRFLPEMDSVDLLHYDSDKSINGRQFAIDAVKNKLSGDAIVVMDDINDDVFFRDWVSATGQQFHVFGLNDKYIGLTGL